MSHSEVLQDTLDIPNSDGNQEPGQGQIGRRRIGLQCHKNLRNQLKEIPKCRSLQETFHDENANGDHLQNDIRCGLHKFGFHGTHDTGSRRLQNSKSQNAQQNTFNESQKVLRNGTRRRP